jgi:hypothetical protein
VTVPDHVSRYDIGDWVRVVATFTSTDGITTADPSTILFLLKNPAGSVATYAFSTGSVQRATVGQYWAEFGIATGGSWFYRWQGTGGVQAAEEFQLVADRSFIL